MLQPRQLLEVQARYALPIAEVRDFLLKAGIPVETPEALAETAARLAADRSFRRDLTSTVWVVLDSGRIGTSGAIGTSELLGILALAAAGPQGAPLASEESAHTLLRFLMGARHSLEDAPPPASVPPLFAPPASAPAMPVQAAAPQAAAPGPAIQQAAAPQSVPSRLAAFQVAEPALPASSPFIEPARPVPAASRSLASALQIAMEAQHEPAHPAPTLPPPAIPALEALPPSAFRTHTAPGRRAVFTSLPDFEEEAESKEMGEAAGGWTAAAPVDPTPGETTAAPEVLHAVPPVPTSPTLHRDRSTPFEHAFAAAGTAAALEAEAANDALPEPLTLATETAGPVPALAAEPEPGLEPDRAESPVFLPTRVGHDHEVDNDRRRARLAWSAAAACIAALVAGAWFLQNDRAPRPATPAPVIQGPSTAAPDTQSAPESHGHAAAPTAVARPQTREQASASGAAPARTAVPAPRTSSALARFWSSLRQRTRALAFPGTSHASESATSEASSSSAEAAQPTLTSPSAPAPGSELSPAAPIVRTAPPSSAIVPSSVLSQRLDSPTVPANSLAQNELDAQGRHSPRLLRRSAGGTLHDNADEDEGDFVAELHTADIPGTPRPGSAANAVPRSSGTARNLASGTVRSTALGTMAGNVVYSPVPTYPSAAAAAGVQGQVKIQATVDRDGNVYYARVVSGPPLLRDAALDAVQHWRYRPNLAHGKAAPALAEAVLDFELP